MIGYERRVEELVSAMDEGAPVSTKDDDFLRSMEERIAEGREISEAQSCWISDCYERYIL